MQQNVIIDVRVLTFNCQLKELKGILKGLFFKYHLSVIFFSSEHTRTHTCPQTNKKTGAWTGDYIQANLRLILSPREKYIILNVIEKLICKTK